MDVIINSLEYKSWFVLGLKGNPLPPDVMNPYNEPRGIEKLLTYLLDQIQGGLNNIPIIKGYFDSHF